MVLSHRLDGVEPRTGGEADDGPAVIVAAVTSRSERRTAGCRLAAITSSVAADDLLQVLSSEPIRIAGDPTPIFDRDEPHRLFLDVHVRDTKMHEKLFAIREELLFTLNGPRCSRLPNNFHLSIDGADLRHVFHDFGL